MSRILANKQETQNFITLIDEVIVRADGLSTLDVLKAFEKERPQKDLNHYTNLLKHKDQFLKPLLSFSRMEALSRQRQVLREQRTLLMIGIQEIEGYVEIGTPGTYIQDLKKDIRVTGPVYSLNSEETFGGYLQAFSLNPFTKFRPYNIFVPLKNDLPISPKDIPDSSVDLVTCYGGLHHISPEKLLPFIHSIHRVLRPGGKFILREHDARTQEIEAQAFAVHLVFNAAIEEAPVMEEKNELRLFAPLQEWISLIENNGFKWDSRFKLLQPRDSTANTLILFEKKEEEPQFQEIHSFLEPLSDSSRPGWNAYLSAPEWL